MRNLIVVGKSDLSSMALRTIDKSKVLFVSMEDNGLPFNTLFADVGPSWVHPPKTAYARYGDGHDCLIIDPLEGIDVLPANVDETGLPFFKNSYLNAAQGYYASSPVAMFLNMKYMY